MLTSNMNSQSDASVLGLINTSTTAKPEFLPSSLVDKQTKFSKLFADLLPNQAAMPANTKLSKLSSDMKSLTGESVSKQEWADALNDLVDAFKGFIVENDADKMPQGILLAQNAVTNLAELSDVQGLNEVLAEYGVTSIDDYIGQTIPAVSQENIAADELDVNFSSSLTEVDVIQSRVSPDEKNLGLSVSGLIEKALNSADLKSSVKPDLAKVEVTEQGQVAKLPEAIGVDEVMGDAANGDLQVDKIKWVTESELKNDKQVKEAIQSLGQYIRDVARQHGKPEEEGSTRVSVADAVHAYQAQYGRMPKDQIENAGLPSAEALESVDSEVAAEMNKLLDQPFAEDLPASVTSRVDNALATDVEGQELLTAQLSDDAMDTLNKEAKAVQQQTSANVDSGELSFSAINENVTLKGVEAEQTLTSELVDNSMATLNKEEVVVVQQTAPVDVGATSKPVESESLEPVKDLAQELQQSHAVASTHSPQASQAQSASVSQAMNSATQASTQTQANQGMTAWGSNNADTSQASANGQSQQQSSHQQASQQWQAQQQLAQVQENLRSKTTALQQQQVVKSADELARADANKELMAITDGGLIERRAQLPSGMQSIPVPMRSPQWGQALGQRVVFMANNNLQQAKITLNPEHLGPVQVKLHIGKDQQMHVSMHAQHLTTREAMENAMPRLKEMLEQAGIDVASVTVGEEDSATDTGSAFAETDSQQDSGHAMTGSDMETEAVTEVLQVVQSDNLVDYYA